MRVPRQLIMLSCHCFCNRSVPSHYHPDTQIGIVYTANGRLCNSVKRRVVQIGTESWVTVLNSIVPTFKRSVPTLQEKNQRETMTRLVISAGKNCTEMLLLLELNWIFDKEIGPQEVGYVLWKRKKEIWYCIHWRPTKHIQSSGLYEKNRPRYMLRRIWMIWRYSMVELCSGKAEVWVHKESVWTKEEAY